MVDSLWVYRVSGPPPFGDVVGAMTASVLGWQTPPHVFTFKVDLVRREVALGGRDVEGFHGSAFPPLGGEGSDDHVRDRGHVLSGWPGE